MGSAAPLFFSANDTEKQTLHRRITPSDEQFEEQQDRWNALADHLITDLKERSAYPIRTWLQGSYKFGTQVRPRLGEEFDIDLGVYFQWNDKPENGHHRAKTLKGFVQSSLDAYLQANADDVVEVTAPKERCCRIRFKDSFHIDVPVYHLDPEHDKRHLATESDAWENSDPKTIYIWFRDCFDDLTRAKVRRYIKYIKAWAALKFVLSNGRPSSILLTVLTADAVVDIGPKNLGSDDDALRDIIQSILHRLEEDSNIPNPVDRSEDLVRMTDAQMQNFTGELRAFLEVAKRATEKNDELSAADVWQESFEHLFPMPDIAQSVAKQAQQLPVPLTLPEIRVTAVSRANPVAGRFSGINGIGPIPKGCDIEFMVTNPYALPHNAQILWMVRNEGREAENINDLGHRAGTGNVASEYSAYGGTHYMDCVVKVAGQTVAIRRIPVTISGQIMARRNPSVRPEWVKLRGRR